MKFKDIKNTWQIKGIKLILKFNLVLWTSCWEAIVSIAWGSAGFLFALNRLEITEEIPIITILELREVFSGMLINWQTFFIVLVIFYGFINYKKMRKMETSSKEKENKQ